MPYYIIKKDDELYHYGVPGMKWGVRRAAKLQAKANMHRDWAKDYDPKDYIGRKPLSEKAKAKMKKAYDRNMATADKYQQKANAKVAKRYAKAGKKEGQAAYERDMGDQAYKKHDTNAKVFDKAAKNYDAQGKVFKAEAARKAAAAIRSRGENIRADRYKTADAYMKRSNKLNQKAKDFASKANIDIGKNKVNAILKASKETGYQNQKAGEQAVQEVRTRQKLGKDGYAIYNQIRRGRSY